MKTAIAYLRVSTKKQVSKEMDPDGMSLPVQREYAEQKAAQLGAVVTEYYIERGQSARSMRRDELQKMITRLKDGSPVDYVIVLSVNRLARDVGDFDRIWDDVITKAGADLVSVMETFDNSASGRFMAHVLSAKAEYDSAQTSERVVMGLARKAQIGGTIGLAPIGYLNETHMIEGRPVKLVAVDPVRGSLIREVFELYATGDVSLVELVDQLQAKGLRTRPTVSQPEKPLAISQISKILHNPYYTGDVVVKGVTYAGRHQALVERDLFERVQEVFKARDATGIRNRRHDHWAKGLVYCEECGARMTLSVARGKYVYWLCMGRNRGEGCEMPYIAVERVDELVGRALASWEPETSDVAGARGDLVAYLERERSAARATITRQRRRMTDLEGRRTQLLELHLDGSIDKALFMRQQESVTSDLHAAERELHAAEATIGREEEIFDAATRALEQPAQRFASLPDDEARRQVALALIDRIWLRRSGADRVEVRQEIAALHQAVKEAGGARYERAGVRVPVFTDVDLARWLDSENPAEPEADRVLISASAPGTRVLLSDFWSG